MSAQLEGDELALAHMGLVDSVVFQGPDPWLTDDLRQEACIGLLQAARSYDPEMGSFERYARIRMRGAIRDALRRYPHPENRRLGKRALVATATDCGEEWDICIESRTSREPDPAEAALEADSVRHILRSLDDRSRVCMEEYHVEERFQRQIAVGLGVSDSRVSQILMTSRARILYLNGLGH